MSKVDLLIAVGIGGAIMLVLAFAGGVMAFLHHIHTPPPPKGLKELTIADLISIVQDPDATEDKLVQTAALFTQRFAFPPKPPGGATPAAAAEYLQFIYFIAAHKQSSARVIAQIDTDIKRLNKDYADEIDKYERDGLAQHVKK